MTNAVQKWREQHAQAIADAWDQLLKQPWGRKLLFELIDSPHFCGTHASTFDPDAAVQSYRNGLRDAGLKLLVAAQKTDPEMYARMIAEAMNARRMLLNAERADADAAAKEP